MLGHTARLVLALHPQNLCSAALPVFSCDTSCALQLQGLQFPAGGLLTLKGDQNSLSRHHVRSHRQGSPETPQALRKQPGMQSSKSLPKSQCALLGSLCSDAAPP